MLKARPELLNGLEARLWSRFFCLSVYITMYLNDHARHYFYEVRFGGGEGRGTGAVGVGCGPPAPAVVCSPCHHLFAFPCPP